METLEKQKAERQLQQTMGVLIAARDMLITEMVRLRDAGAICDNMTATLALCEGLEPLRKFLKNNPAVRAEGKLAEPLPLS
jgi:hypothetical protein